MPAGPCAFVRFPMNAILNPRVITRQPPVGSVPVEGNRQSPQMERISPLGRVIKQKLAELGHSQAWLAEKCGVSANAVTKWIRSGQISRENLAALSAAIKVSSDSLIGRAGALNVEDGPIIRNLLPQISWVQAGRWNEVYDPLQPGEYEALVPVTKKMSPRSFALRVTGDSMEPLFPEGSIIAVDPERQAKHKSYVVVRQNGNFEVTFKQLVIDGGRSYLKPVNPRYPIMDLGPDAVICGVVRQMLLDFD